MSPIKSELETVAKHLGEDSESAKLSWVESSQMLYYEMCSREKLMQINQWVKQSQN